MSTQQQPFIPEPDPTSHPWESDQERQIERRQQREAQAHEADHGRHGDDRSRPSTFVRKNR